MNYNKQTATFRLSIEVLEKLQKLSNTSKFNKSELVEAALRLLFKTPGETK